MGDCCSNQEQSIVLAVNETPKAPAKCAECGSVERTVQRQTVLHHVRSEELGRVRDEVYRFCPDPVCAVVYYSEGGTSFTAPDLRELVSVKASGDARPLCYCFGFTEGNAREEIAHTGGSTIPARISRFIKEGMCACEVRNPSGACCLGEVNKTVKRLTEEHETDIEPLVAESHDCCSV